MKYKIKKYRSIVSQEFDIEFGKINFFIGGNESGKSNILKSINFMGKNSKEKFIASRDTTKLAKWLLDNPTKDQKNKKAYFDKLATSFEINDNDKTLKINTGGEPIWLFNDSVHHRKLILLFKEKESFLGKVAIQVPGYANIIHQAKELVKNQFPKLEKLEHIMSLVDECRNTNIEKHIIDLNDKIKAIYKSAELGHPTTYLIIPYNKSSKAERLEYRISDIMDTRSQINSIFTCFGDKQRLEELYYQEGEEINRDIVDSRTTFVERLNTSIKEYFNQFEYIKVIPKLITDNSIVYLSIKEKDKYKYEIHIDDENERSLGYKYFSRLILELKSITETTHPDKNVIYMIDEPEQSLHPHLQEILINEMRKLIKDKKNIAIVLATHSIYSFDINSNVFFVERNSKTSETDFFGETKIIKLDDKSLNQTISSDTKESEFIKKFIFDKWKMIWLKNNDVKNILESQDKNTIDWRNEKISFEEYTNNINYIHHNTK